MTRSDERRLIRDLFDLYARYGDAGFRRAIELLRNPRTLEDILETIVEAAPLGRRAPIGERLGEVRRTIVTPEQRLETLDKELDEKHHPMGHDIKALARDIGEKKVLSSDRLLRNFIHLLEPHARIAKIDRLSIARRVGRNLVSMPEADVRKLIDLARREPTESTLEGWSRVIVRG